MTNEFQKVSDSLYINPVTNYKVEYWDDNVECYVVFNKDGFVVWDFPTLEEAFNCADEDYKSSIEWEKYWEEGNI